MCVSYFVLFFLFFLYETVWKATARDIMSQPSQECPGFCGPYENKKTT